MPPRPFRTHNRFGRRFIKPEELWQYAGDLGVKLPIGGNSFLEFLEREGILFPVRRIAYGASLVRRLAKEDDDGHPSETILEPIESDDALTQAALSLHRELSSPTWSKPQFFGETQHVLDSIQPQHAAFVRTSFSKKSFVPWEDNQVFAYLIDGRQVYAGDNYYPTYYHYWQVFPLTTYLRSAATIYYPLAVSFQQVVHPARAGRS